MTAVTNLHTLSKMIDHALLAPKMTDSEIIAGCELAKKYDVAAVCVKPYAIPLVKEKLFGSTVAVCTVISFPHGSCSTEVKLLETQSCMKAGATAIDVVVNIGKVLGGDFDYVASEIEAVNKTVTSAGAILKVIFENAYLNNEQIVKLCQICTEKKVAYVKTATGFDYIQQTDGKFLPQGALGAQVALMRKHCPLSVKIKASGGVKNLAHLMKFKELGCSRIGTSSTAAILDEAKGVVG